MNAIEPLERTSVFAARLDAVLSDIRSLLIAKNRAYGDSALNPVRVFANSDCVEQLKVRIDDKISRLVRGHTFATEDTANDLLGYLILLKIAETIERERSDAA